MKDKLGWIYSLHGWCNTDAEIAINADICEKLPDYSVPESVRFAGIGNGRRNTEVQASVWDAMMAELQGDKERRAEKWRKTHDRCKKSKDKTPADRRKDKMNRMYRLYGRMWEDGHYWYWEHREGCKQTTEPDAEILRNMKVAEMEKAAYAELLPDREHIVGKTTLSGMINRLWKQMAELRKPYEDKGYECFENYYYRYFNGYRFMMNYTTEYYDVQSDYEYLVRWADVLAARKKGVALYELEKADAEYFCESGQRVFDRLVKQMNPEPHYIDDGWNNWAKYQEELDEQYWKDLWAQEDELEGYLWDYSIAHMGEEDDWND